MERRVAASLVDQRTQYRFISIFQAKTGERRQRNRKGGPISQNGWTHPEDYLDSSISL